MYAIRSYYDFLLGALLFWGGFAIHVHADHVIRSLRRPGETGYAIPRGGLRITSYNVCYTKLLRLSASRRLRRRFPRPERGVIQAPQNVYLRT